MSVGSDDAGEVWMTKAELAAVRRISVASADRLARRMKWRKQPGNDGRARVLVPTDWSRPPKDGTESGPGQRPKDGPTDNPTGNPSDISRISNAFEVALTVVRDQLAVANRRTEQIERERDALRADLARAEDRLREAEIERLVEAAARRSMFRRLWRRRG
jgi:hypothetical protein